VRHPVGSEPGFLDREVAAPEVISKRDESTMSTSAATIYLNERRIG
jgi:hypothetical protein